MSWRARGSAPLSFFIIFSTASLLLASCVGVTPMTPTALPPTNTHTPSPTSRPTDTPRPSPSPSPTISPTYTPTLAPTPTRDPTMARLPTPVLEEAESVVEGGYTFRHLGGFVVREQGKTRTLLNEQTGIIMSLTGVPTRSFRSIERVITGLLENMGNSFKDFTHEPYFALPVDGFDGIASIIHGELSGEMVSGLVVVVAPSDSHLFYAITFIPDGPQGSVWESDGWPVVDAVLSSLEFFTPVPN